MNTLSKLTLISVMISAMAGCSVRKDGNNLSNVTTADSLLFTEPLDTLPDGVISSVSWLPLQNSDQRIIDEISKLFVVDSFIVIGSAGKLFCRFIPPKVSSCMRFPKRDRDRKNILKSQHLLSLLLPYIFLITFLIKYPAMHLKRELSWEKRKFLS